MSGRFIVAPEDSAPDSHGHASPVVATTAPLSFMMGVDPKTGTVIDNHHPLRGTSLTDKVFVLPSGRGSCSGGGIVVELLLQGVAPAALVFRRLDEILALGVIMAKVMMGRSMPVAVIDDDDTFNTLLSAKTVVFHSDGLTYDEGTFIPLSPEATDQMALTESDQHLLKHDNEATRMAMEITLRYAAMQGATRLLDVSQIHIDAVVYVGESSLLIPRRLLDSGARFVVPATCNSLSVDRQRWQQLGADATLSRLAGDVGDAYMAMGAVPSFTCAPYTLPTAPGQGEQVGWSESNAVVFANSVLGARTQKYPDYIEVMMGITGRAPCFGCHLPEGRVPSAAITVPDAVQGGRVDGALFPLLGYHIGGLVGSRIPVVYGLETTAPTKSNLKDFSAAFATSSSAAMFHMAGVTPEIADGTVKAPRDIETVALQMDELRHSWRQLSSAMASADAAEELEAKVDLISLGNPHLTLEELELIAQLCRDKTKAPGTHLMLTTNRHVYGQAAARGLIDAVETFGGRFITDTCWCMIEEPVIPVDCRTIMTNSGKYAHYGPAVTGRRFFFGSVEACVRTACGGYVDKGDMMPRWLFP